MNGNKNKRHKSSIFSCLSRFSEYIYSKIPNSFTANLLTRKENNRGLHSKLWKKVRFEKRISLPIKRYIAKGFDRSFILTYLRSLIEKIPLIQLKCVGMFYFAFGLYTSIVHLLNTRLITRSGNNSTLIVGISLCVIGGIFSGSQKTCYAAFTESTILSGIFIKMLGIPKNNTYLRSEPIGKTNVFFLSGIVLGISGSITSFKFASLLFPVLTAFYAILAFPESGAVALFLLLPFLTTSQLCLFSAFIAISFLFKLMRGKRVLSLSSLDFTVIAFAVAIFFGGIISVSPRESFAQSMLFLSILAGCFAITNLIRTPEWIKRCAFALITSFTISLIFALIGVLVHFLPEVRTAFLSDILTSGMTYLFSVNPLLIHLTVAIIPLILYSAFSSKSANKVSWALLATVLSMACVLIGGSRSAFISIVAGIIILLLLTSKKSLAHIIPAVILIPCVIALMPAQITNRFMRIFSFEGVIASYRQTVSATTNKMVTDSFFGGIGLGDAAFERVFPLYANDSAQQISHAPDLYTQITLALGFAGLIIFAVFIYKLMRRYFSYICQSTKDDGEVKIAITASFCGISGLLIMGTVDYIWHSPSVFMAFWLMVALFASSTRTAEELRYTPISDGPSLEIDCQTLRQRKDKR